MVFMLQLRKKINAEPVSKLVLPFNLSFFVCNSFFDIEKPEDEGGYAIFNFSIPSNHQEDSLISESLYLR